MPTKKRAATAAADGDKGTKKPRALKAARCFTATNKLDVDIPTKVKVKLNRKRQEELTNCQVRRVFSPPEGESGPITINDIKTSKIQTDDLSYGWDAENKKHYWVHVMVKDIKEVQTELPASLSAKMTGGQPTGRRKGIGGQPTQELAATRPALMADLKPVDRATVIKMSDTTRPSSFAIRPMALTPKGQVRYPYFFARGKTTVYW